MLLMHKIFVAFAVLLSSVFQGLLAQPPAEQMAAMKELGAGTVKLCDSIIEWQLSNKANTKTDENLSQKIKEAFNNYDAALKKANSAGMRVPPNRCLEELARNIEGTIPTSTGQTVIVQ